MDLEAFINKKQKELIRKLSAKRFEVMYFKSRSNLTLGQIEFIKRHLTNKFGSEIVIYDPNRRMNNTYNIGSTEIKFRVVDEMI
jgi:hypothetical protein